MPNPTTRTLLAPLVWILMLHLAAAASAESDYVLSSGASGGYYHGVASRLASVLAQEGIAVQHEESVGSLANLALLDDAENPTNVVLAQADAVRHYLDEHPTLAEKLVVMDDLGRECVVLITGKDDGIASAADLKTGRFGSLVVPGLGSGAAVTFEYMSRMDPGYRKTEMTAREPMEAMLDMRRPGGEKIAAVMLVKRPRSLSSELEIVLDNQDVYRIAAVRPQDVESGKLPDGSPVYSFDEVHTGAGVDYRISYETMCTRALLVTSSTKLGNAKRRELAKLLLKWRSLIAPGR